jgi:hypothetical protein
VLAKLVAIVLALALTAASLLAVRQQRLQAVSEMATAIERAAALDRQAWRARVEIAKRVAPEALERELAGRGELDPIRVEWCEIVDVGPAAGGGLLADDEAGRGHGG